MERGTWNAPTLKHYSAELTIVGGMLLYTHTLTETNLRVVYPIENKSNQIKLFEETLVRVARDEDNEKWWLSVVDVVAVLTDNDYQTARKYWKNLKSRMLKEGSEIRLVTDCYQLKMQSSDGKFYNTDVGDTEQILRPERLFRKLDKPANQIYGGSKRTDR